MKSEVIRYTRKVGRPNQEFKELLIPLNGKVARRTRTPGSHRKGWGTLKSYWENFRKQNPEMPGLAAVE